MAYAAVIPWTLYSRDGRRKYLNAPEREAFLAAALAAPATVETLCLCLYWTGCRISEAIALTDASFDRHSGTVAIRSLKKRNTGEAIVREVPVPAAFFDRLNQVHGDAGRKQRLWPIARVTAWRQIKDIMIAAEIVGVAASPKGLRHGFGVHAIRSGIPLDLVSRWLGHADIATTAIYTAVVGPDEQEIAARMWRGLQDPPFHRAGSAVSCQRCLMHAN